MVIATKRYAHFRPRLSRGEVLLYTSVPQALATQFADAFMKKRPDIKLEIYRAGSTKSVRSSRRSAKSEVFAPICSGSPTRRSIMT